MSSPARVSLSPLPFPLHALREQALREGMTCLRQDGWRKVVAGQTTIEEVIAATQADEP